MPDLLLELFSEEIPARMQRRAAEDLRKLVTDALVARGFLYEGAKAFATPRRLALTIAGLPAKGKDVREERKGPRVGAPEAAIQGFVKSAGLSSIEEAVIERDPKKGEFYTAVIEKPGEETADALAAILPQVVRDFPWPKSMRWGAASSEPGSLRWVRPLHSILCTFGPETETPEIVAFAVDGIAAGDVSRGHRFHAPEPFTARHFDDYVRRLEAARVVLDADRRRDIIRTDAQNLAFAAGLDLVEDEGLLEEVAGLVEWPVVLKGSFDESFLAIPPEVIRATIRANQKCFVLRRADGGLANAFLLVANLEASDGGAAIVAGNERVVRARLSDAKFFWETDRAPLPDFSSASDKPLDQRLAKLRALNIVFHQKLGTQGERIERIAALARELCTVTGADPELAVRAAHLAKADLVTEMVGEFPELQGLMGRYYATAQGEHESVAAAVEDHYKPLGPSDRVPTDPVAVTVALADKLDTLVGFWAIDEKPTGSKDPYALRRAALGVIRLVLENGLRLPLSAFSIQTYATLLGQFSERQNLFAADGDDFYQVIAHYLGPHCQFNSKQRYLVLFGASRSIREGDEEIFVVNGKSGDGTNLPKFVTTGDDLATDLLAFFHDRLKVHLREAGARHDLIDAVLAPTQKTLPLVGRVGGEADGVGGAPLGASSANEPLPDPPPPLTPPRKGEGKASEREGKASEGEGRSPATASGSASDDLLMIVRRVEALGKFLDTEDGKNLLAGYRRAANILRIEEKKDSRAFDGIPQVDEMVLPEETGLAVALAQASRATSEAVAREDFGGAMLALSQLRAPVDAFFDKVTVNDENPRLRENRLMLLNALRAATREVADFGKIAG